MTTPVHVVRIAMMSVAAFIIGELGLLLLGLALSVFFGFSVPTNVAAAPACAVVGLFLVAIACALIFVVALEKG